MTSKNIAQASKLAMVGQRHLFVALSFRFKIAE